jgi:riboflavin transporter FmnP
MCAKEGRNKMSTEDNTDRVNQQGGTVRKSRTHLLTKMGMMLAISVVFSFIHFPLLPAVGFIEYELSDLPLLISGFAFGPVAGLVISVLSILLHDLLMGPASGSLYGMIMHMLAIGMYILVSGLVYRKHKDIKHALIGLLIGILAATAIMVPANLLVTPLFLGPASLGLVKSLMFTAIIPVNLLKGLISAVLTFILYKRVSPFLHR